jgi:hypothetical protein
MWKSRLSVDASSANLVNTPDSRLRRMTEVVWQIFVIDHTFDIVTMLKSFVGSLFLGAIALRDVSKKAAALRSAFKRSQASL